MTGLLSGIKYIIELKSSIKSNSDRIGPYPWSTKLILYHKEDAHDLSETTRYSEKGSSEIYLGDMLFVYFDIKSQLG